MIQPRWHHKSVRLEDGRVLIVGGDQLTEDGLTNRMADLIEIYDPETGTFEALEKLPYGIYPTQLITNKDGKVFLLGNRVTLPSDDVIPGAVGLLAKDMALAPGSRGIAAANAPGGALIQISVKGRQVEYLTINQVVERMLDDKEQMLPPWTRDPVKWSWRASVAKIANRPAVIRAYMTSSKVNDPMDVTLKVEGSGGTYSQVVSIIVPTSNDLKDPKRGLVAQFYLPAQYVTADAHVKIIVDKKILKEADLNAVNTDPIDIFLVPMRYIDKNGQLYFNSAIGSQFDAIKARMEALLPTAEVKLHILPQNDPYWGFTWDRQKEVKSLLEWAPLFTLINDDVDGWDRLAHHWANQSMKRLGGNPQPKNKLYCLVVPEIPNETFSTSASNTVGAANRGQHFPTFFIQATDNASLASVHEIGHSFDSSHTGALCHEKAPDSNFPYIYTTQMGNTPSGQIHNIGWDCRSTSVSGLKKEEIYISSNATEIMAYLCPLSQNQKLWVSDYTFAKWCSHLEINAAPATNAIEYQIINNKNSEQSEKTTANPAADGLILEGELLMNSNGYGTICANSLIKQVIQTESGIRQRPETGYKLVVKTVGAPDITVPCQVTPVFKPGFYTWQAVLPSYIKIERYLLIQNGNTLAEGILPNDDRIPVFSIHFDGDLVNWEIIGSTHGTGVFISWDNGATWKLLDALHPKGETNYKLPGDPEQIHALFKLQGFIGGNVFEQVFP